MNLKSSEGQMTVEFVVMLPVILAIAAIALYAISYLSICLAFDRALCEAVRVSTESSYVDGTAADYIESDIVKTLQENSGVEITDGCIEVSSTTSMVGHVRYEGSIRIEPEMLGMPLAHIFGYVVPDITHTYDVIAMRPRNAVIM